MLPEALTKWMETKSLRCSHLGPIRHPADVARVAQRHGGEPHGLAFGNPHFDRLRRDGLTEPVLAIDHGEYGRVDQHVHRLIGENQPFAFHLDITRHPHDAMAVVTGQIRADQVSCDAIRFPCGSNRLRRRYRPPAARGRHVR